MTRRRQFRVNELGSASLGIDEHASPKRAADQRIARLRIIRMAFLGLELLFHAQPERSPLEALRSLVEWLRGADSSARPDAWARLDEALGRHEASLRWLAAFAASDAAET
jgi:hypothetical protein